MKYAVLSLFALLPLWLCAQGTQSVARQLARPDSVHAVSSEVDVKGAAGTLIEKLDAPQPNQTIKGHRVCIFMEKNQSARGKAFEAEAIFKQAYPDIPTYVIYDKTSYWKVIVGNCLTVDEVTMLKAKAEKLFPSKPFIVQEDIPVSEFGKNGRDIASSQYLSSHRQSGDGTAEDVRQRPQPWSGMVLMPSAPEE